MPTWRRSTCALSQAPVWKSAASSELGVARADDPRVRGGHARRRARDARRTRARRQRSARPTSCPRSAAAARRTSGCWRTIRTRRRSAPCSPGSGPACSARTTSRRAWSRISSGWAATPCAARTPRACCCARSPRAAMRACGAHARQICRDLGAVVRGRRSVRRAAPRADSQGLHADVKHLAWCASQVRNRLSARYWRGVVGSAAPDAGSAGHARQQPRGLRTPAAVARGAHRLLRRRHDARRGLARDAPRPPHRAHAVRRQHPGAPARERARHAPRGGRVAARRLRQHAYLPRAVPRRAAALARCSTCCCTTTGTRWRWRSIAARSTAISTTWRVRSAASASAACRTCRCCRDGSAELLDARGRGR